MAAHAGEPWRGLTRINVDRGTGQRQFWVTVVGNGTFGDQSTWEGTPGSSFTLEFRENNSGVTPPGTADTVRVRCYVPGTTTQIGSEWNPTASGQTRTFHFDDDPLNQSSGTARTGTVELYLKVERTSVGTYDVDSRGTGSAGSDAWARGYLRATSTLASTTLSNVAIDGAEPATWAFDDPIHAKAVLAAQPYRTGELQVAVRDAGGSDVQAAATTTSGTSQTKSWTATGEKVDNSFNVGSDDYVWRWPVRDFGGDNEYTWATSGHASGFTRESERTLAHVARLTVDPRVVVANHLQLDDGTYNASLATTRRQTYKLGFATFTLTNARGTALSGITATETLTDADGLVAAAINRSVATQANGRPTSMATWDSGLPTGNWTHAVTVTAPSHAVGIEQNPTATWQLVAANPDLMAFIGGGNAENQKDHFRPGVNLVLAMSVVDTSTWTAVTPDASSLAVVIGRANLATGKRQYLDPSTLAWVDFTGAAVPFTETTTPALTASPADSKLFTLTIPAATTATWTEHYDVIPVLRATVDGAGVTNYIQTTLEGALNRHGAQAFDPTGLFK